MTPLKSVILFSVAALAGSATALAAQPYQWTPAQASAALQRQAEDFYVETTDTGNKLPRDLMAARCRGTGKNVQRRFVAFSCTATVQRGAGDSPLNVRVVAKTRRAGGLCWAFPPAPIPSGCLARGKRGEGSVEDAFSALVRRIGTLNQGIRCLAHGAGFFTCSWTDSEGPHRGTVTFAPRPKVKVLA